LLPRVPNCCGCRHVAGRHCMRPTPGPWDCVPFPCCLV
jgi:hypothetical protein